MSSLPPPPPGSEPVSFDPPPGSPPRDEPNVAALVPAPSELSVFRYSKINLGRPIVAKGYGSVVEFDGLLLSIHHSGVRAKLNGLTAQQISTDDITDITWKAPTALVNGYLRVVTVDQFGNRSDEGDHMSDSLAVQITKQQVARFVELRSALDFAKTHGSTV